MLVIACPGQGSQKPGFLSPWLELPGVRDRLEWLSAAAATDLVAHGTVSDEATIKDTAVAQPLIVAAGIVALSALADDPAWDVRRLAAAAGHSVGEITAAAATGVLSPEQAMVFVRLRGRAMAQAAAQVPTGMTAVLGGDPDDVSARLDRHGLEPANVNGAGQVVAAGTLEQLASFAAEPPAKARLMPLSVAGAFHTRHMAPALDTLAGYARVVETRDPAVPLLSDREGSAVTSGAEYLGRIVDQVTRPVRWDAVMQTMRDMGVTGLIEIPPAGALAGLAKRALPGVEVLALKGPEDLDAARRMIAEHGAPESAVGHAPSWRLVVSPAKGVLAPAASLPGVGEAVQPGATVAHVESLRDRSPVVAAHGGTVLEWLAEPGDPVSPGQPLVRVHPLVGAAR